MAWASGADVAEYGRLTSDLWPQRSAKIRPAVASALAKLSPELTPSARLTDDEWRPLYRVLHALRDGTSRDTSLQLAMIDLIRIDGGAEAVRQLERLLKGWRPFPYQTAVHSAASTCLADIQSRQVVADHVRGLLHPASAPKDELLRPAEGSGVAAPGAELRQAKKP